MSRPLTYCKICIIFSVFILWMILSVSIQQKAGCFRHSQTSCLCVKCLATWFYMIKSFRESSGWHFPLFRKDDLYSYDWCLQRAGIASSKKSNVTYLQNTIWVGPGIPTRSVWWNKWWSWQSSFQRNISRLRRHCNRQVQYCTVVLHTPNLPLLHTDDCMRMCFCNCIRLINSYWVCVCLHVCFICACSMCIPCAWFCAVSFSLHVHDLWNVCPGEASYEFYK